MSPKKIKDFRKDSELYSYLSKKYIKLEEGEVLEEVFDKPTLMTLYKLINRGVIESLVGVVKSGKEAKIYRALGSKGEELAVKIYLTVSAEFRRGMLPYLEGDIRFSHVRRDIRSLVYAWAQKEFKNLKKAWEIGVRVPKPYTVENNILVIEFIGRDGIPAPLLKDAEVSNPEKVYKKLLNYIKTLYRDGELVHGDLSEYNVMVLDSEPVIFDMSQAVLLSHPLADQLLRRDITNLNRFFRKLGVKVKPEDEIYRWVTQDESNA